MNALVFHLHAAGVLAPGIGSLAELRAIGCNSAAYAAAPLQLPSPAMLPAQERRRASQAVRLALAAIAQALAGWPFAADALRSVFATDEGTGEVCQQMLEALATTRQVSPLLFANSVLNAPSGYFSIAWANREPSTVVSLGLDSFASGLLCAVTEAHVTGQAVLLVAYDPPMTSPLDELLPVREAIASAWIISCEPACRPVLGSFDLVLQPAGSSLPSPLPGWMPQGWSAHASARGLAALGLLDQVDGGAYRMPLGGQLLCLQRTQGAAT